MSDLYGQLSRLFQEVSPLPVAGKKRRTKKTADPGLFAEPSAIHKVQVLPGVFEERPFVNQTERPCLVVLDSPRPVLLLGTTVDFTETEFKYHGFQVPLHIGSSMTWNVDEAFVKALEGRRQLAAIKSLDQELQELIVLLKEAVKAGLSAELVHEALEKLRVWSLEDYRKPSFLKSIVTTLMSLSDALYATGTGIPAIDAGKKQVAIVRKELKGVESALKSTLKPESAMLEALIGLVPTMRSNKVWLGTLQAYMADPEGGMNKLVSEKTLPLGMWEAFTNKNLGDAPFWVNNAYLTFAQSQTKG